MMKSAQELKTQAWLAWEAAARHSLHNNAGIDDVLLGGVVSAASAGYRPSSGRPMAGMSEWKTRDYRQVVSVFERWRNGTHRPAPDDRNRSPTKGYCRLLPTDTSTDGQADRELPKPSLAKR